MSETKLSLFELHFHDSVQFGPRTLPGLSGDSDQETGGEGAAGSSDPTEPPASEDEPVVGDESGPCIGCRLLGLGVLVAAAYAVRKLLDGGPSGLDGLDDIEEELGGGAGDIGDDVAESDDAVSIEVTSGEGSTSSAGTKGLAAAAAVALLLLLALAARKLLGGGEEIVVEE